MSIPCIGISADKTFAHTVRAIARAGAAPAVIDLAALSTSGRLYLDYENNSSWLEVEGVVTELTTWTPVCARLLEISLGTSDEQFVDRSRGMLFSLTKWLGCHKGKVINRPSSDVSNCSKFFHQRHIIDAVHSHGISVPETLLTSDPASAAEFVRYWGGNVIYKGCSAFKTVVAKWSEEDWERLSLISNLPVLLQRRILGPDVRVHVVNGNVFAELIVSSDVDYRFASERGSTRFFSLELPGNVRSACCALQMMHGIEFVGIDFKIDVSDWRWYILEMNGMPAYQGYDRRAEGQISAAIVQYLLN